MTSEGAYNNKTSGDKWKVVFAASGKGQKARNSWKGSLWYLSSRWFSSAVQIWLFWWREAARQCRRQGFPLTHALQRRCWQKSAKIHLRFTYSYFDYNIKQTWRSNWCVWLEPCRHLWLLIGRLHGRDRLEGGILKHFRLVVERYVELQETIISARQSRSIQILSFIRFFDYFWLFCWTVVDGPEWGWVADTISPLWEKTSGFNQHLCWVISNDSLLSYSCRQLLNSVQLTTSCSQCQWSNPRVARTGWKFPKRSGGRRDRGGWGLSFPASSAADFSH